MEQDKYATSAQAGCAAIPMGPTRGETIAAVEQNIRQNEAKQRAADSLTKCAEEQPAFSVRLTPSLIRRLAAASPEANRKLRAQVPQAFIGAIVPLYAASRSYGPFAEGYTTLYGSLVVSQEYRGDGPRSVPVPGLHLDSSFDWSLMPGPDGVGMTLVAREKF